MGDDLSHAAALQTLVFSHATPAAPNRPTIPTNAPTPTPPQQGPQAEITDGEAAKIIAWAKEDLLRNKISPTQADKIFDQLGVPADQQTTPPDTRTDEQKLIDEQFAVGRAQDFRLAYADPGQPAPPMTKELAHFDASARNWLVGAEFPTDLGNSLITQIARVAQQTKAMTPDQLESYGIAEYEKLQRVYGDTLDAKLEAAGRMVEALELAKPGLKNLLRAKGIGDNAVIANMLIGQAERYWLRRKGR